MSEAKVDTIDTHELSDEQCRVARMSRDRRFDGRFFVAVKTTGIYCRPVCPVRLPEERNVSYYSTALSAAQAGYRPCLRCRPDSAPGSPAWLGKGATLQRALRLIDEGILQRMSMDAFAEKLGISARYLRLLFQESLGVSPKTYAQYQQCLFAKSLLHATQLPITEVALASGFNSIRRFNDCFKQVMSLSPSDIRRGQTSNQKTMSILLQYRPPYDWQALKQFLTPRLIPGLEWIGDDFYGRTFVFDDCLGEFTAHHQADKSGFLVDIVMDDLKYLRQVIAQVRRVLDLDADMQLIDAGLGEALSQTDFSLNGLRLPGVWSPFEAAIRAVLGQQVSVKAAHNFVSQVVDVHPNNSETRRYFPTPSQLLMSGIFDQLRMPGTRKATLTRVCEWCDTHTLTDPKALLELKGIGPWTVDYLSMRGFSDPDIFLAGDLGVKKALKQLTHDIEPEKASPWRSYLTFYLWSQL